MSLQSQQIFDANIYFFSTIKIPARIKWKFKKFHAWFLWRIWNLIQRHFSIIPLCRKQIWLQNSSHHHISHFYTSCDLWWDMSEFSWCLFILGQNAMPSRPHIFIKARAANYLDFVLFICTFIFLQQQTVVMLVKKTNLKNIL